MYNHVYDEHERCVYCGELVPEGEMICPICAEKLLNKNKKIKIKPKVKDVDEKKNSDFKRLFKRAFSKRKVNSK